MERKTDRKHMSDTPHKELSRTLLATLVSILVTVLSVMVTFLSGPTGKRYAEFVAYLFLAATLIGLTLIYLDAYISDLRKAQSEARTAEHVRRHMPTILTFQRREDIVTVDPNGNGLITWDWLLRSDPSRSVSEIAFPVLFTNSPPLPDTPQVIIDFLEVNDRRINTANALHLTERRELLSDEAKRAWGGAEYIFYGHLRVPVEFDEGRDICKIRAALRFIHVFGDPTDEIYVDVPYVVERLRVTINDQQRIVRKNLSGGSHVILAKSLMDVVDGAESTEQSHLLKQIGDGLVWETDSVKVGYSYSINIRYEDRSLS